MQRERFDRLNSAFHCGIDQMPGHEDISRQLVRSRFFSTTQTTSVKSIINNAITNSLTMKNKVSAFMGNRKSAPSVGVLSIYVYSITT